MKLKILSVGFRLASRNIQNVSFYEAPSFSDYDVVLIDPSGVSSAWEGLAPQADGTLLTHSLYDSGFGMGLTNMMARRAEEAKLLLVVTKGILVCLLRQKGPILNFTRYIGSTKYAQEISRYTWLPSREYTHLHERVDTFDGKMRTKAEKHLLSGSTFNPSPRVGRVMGEIDRAHPFHQYFSVLGSEIQFEGVIADSGLLRFGRPIAKTKVGETVGFDLPFGEGRIIFLPPFADSADKEKVQGILVDCIRKSLEWRQPLAMPAWLGKYTLPGEIEVKQEVDGIHGEMVALEKKMEKIQTRGRRLEALKSILYEQGKFGLEPPIRQAFSLLGFTVLDPEEYDEDYDLYIKEKDLEIIGEIEGTEKQVNLGKFRQLLNYVVDRTSEGKNCKGILAGNGFIGSDPDERGEQFTDAAIRNCRKQKYCRISTYELFKAVRAVLSDPENGALKKSIKEQILACEDQFTFDEPTAERA